MAKLYVGQNVKRNESGQMCDSVETCFLRCLRYKITPLRERQERDVRVREERCASSHVVSVSNHMCDERNEKRECDACEELS